MNDATDPPAGSLAAIKAALDARAREYDAATHGPLEPVASYRTSEGATHRVCVNQHPHVDWRVIDEGPDGRLTFVARLDGVDDLQRQAVACAQDYAEQCQLFWLGAREHPPIARPEPMRTEETCQEAAPTPAPGREAHPTNTEGGGDERRRRGPQVARGHPPARRPAGV